MILAAGGVAAALLLTGVVGGAGPSGPAIAVEVRAVRTTMLGKDTSQPIGPAHVAAIRERHDVHAVVPRLELRTRALGTAVIDGQDVKFEVGGFADGIPAEAVADDAALANVFVDLDAAAAGLPCPCPERGDYCDARDGRCHPKVPVLVSPTMVSLWNDRFAAEHGLAWLDAPGLAAAIDRGQFAFTITLGESMLPYGDARPRHTVEAIVVGVSPRAKSIGLTVPIGHVASWNIAEPDAPPDVRYSSLEVTLRARDRVAPFARWLHDTYGLEAETIATARATPPR